MIVRSQKMICYSAVWNLKDETVGETVNSEQQTDAGLKLIEWLTADRRTDKQRGAIDPVRY